MDILPQDNTLRKCSNPDCENPWLPATPEYFYARKGLSDPLNKQCKECVKKRVTAHYHEPEAHAKVQERRHRPDVRDRERAYSRKRLDRPEIRTKHNQWQRERYHRPDVREKVLEYSRRPDVQERHRESERKRYQRPEVRARISARDRRYRQKPGVREHKRDYSRAYYHRPGVHERLRDYHNAYYRVYDRLPEQQLRRRVKGHNRTIRKKAIAGTHTAAQIAEQLKRQHYRCYYAKCGFSKFPKVNGKYVFEVEHTFPISRVAGTGIPANDMSYLVLSCEKCNGSKGNKFPWEWPEGGRLL